jgi:aspartate-semialdehyde dehydrogenase
MREYNVAVVGATGEVGKTMREILEERDFPVKNIKLLASERSEGKVVEFKGEKVKVEKLTKESFKGVEVALFSAGGAISKEFAPIAAEYGTVVIDNSSAWRMEPDIPLVVPEVNSHDIKDYKNRNIIANPNCSTIQMVVPLKPIHDKVKIKRIVVSTYQAVSGSGHKAIEELASQTMAIFNQKEIITKVYPHQIAFNCLPHIDVFLDTGYTKEEMKMVNETKKIMGDDSIQVTATTVRVPVFYSHSESVNIETEQKISAEDVMELMKTAPGVVLVDNVGENVYPLPVNAAGTDPVYVGRIREDFSIENGINMWVVADNVRKGAALNAVQIAEVLVKEYM